MAQNSSTSTQPSNSTTSTSNHQHQSSKQVNSNLANMSLDDEDQFIDEQYNTMELFESLQNIDINQLFDKDILNVLPFLTKLLLSKSFIRKQQLLKLLYNHQQMNDVMQYMTAKNIETCDTVTLPPESSFEYCSHRGKLRLVAAEYINIHGRARQSTLNCNLNAKLLHSNLLDNPIYVRDISYCLCTLLLNPKIKNSIMNIIDMTEALLHVKYGTVYIITLVANMPDYCSEICESLINHGDRQDEGGSFNEVSENRAKSLRLICNMNPAIAFTVRSLTLHTKRMPSLTVMITLDSMTSALTKYNSLVKSIQNESVDSSKDAMDIDNSEELKAALIDLEESFDSGITFISGILLGVDDSIRQWFAQYLKAAQQKRIDQNHFTILSKFRSQLIDYMNILFSGLIEDYDLENTSDIVMVSKKDEQKVLNRKLIRATATLRLYCALRGLGSLKLNQDESDILLRLITCKLPLNETSVYFATAGVCTLLVCSALINNSKEERRAAEWLKWLIKKSNYGDIRYSSQGKCSISELLLLIATHFQNNQSNQIAELICTTLGMKLQIKASVSKCKSLFVQEVFNDQMVAEHAVRVPVTKRLNNKITEFLPVHCIHQLLESRSFSKHQIPIKEWIYRQICQCEKPIHNILPKLIEVYVNSIIVSTSAHGHCGTNQPLEESEISRVFSYQLYSNKSLKISNKQSRDLNSQSETTSNPKQSSATKKKIKKEKDTPVSEPMEICDEKENLDTSHCSTISDEPKVVDVESAQVLLLYYLLLYEDIRLKKNSDLSSSERAKLIKYNPDFMMDIPIFYLLQLVRDNQNSFGVILPGLLKLVTTQYPQLCSIQHWLNIENYEPYSTSRSANQNQSIELVPLRAEEGQIKPEVKENLMKQLRQGFDDLHNDPLAVTKTLKSISSLKREEIWPYVDMFIDNWPRIIHLKSTVDPNYVKLKQISAKLWWKFNTIFPRKLWVMTVNALKRPQNLRLSQDIRPVEYSWDELALDPLIVLRCDSRVFRCTDTLNIILHILSAFLAASRRCLQDQINELPGNQKDTRNLEELKTTLILAQTSAAIQILLESCQPTSPEQDAIYKRESGIELDKNDDWLLEKFEASVNLICEHLHQVFIADTNLAKLVHFQTYPSDLLATTSDKIPSMHICLDFIPELLSQPDLSKQVFVIELTSHLCEKYAITKSLNVAKLCFNVAYTLLQLLPSDRRALFFVPVLPALMRICKVFPILKEDAELILHQIEQVTLAHIASTSSRLSLSPSKSMTGIKDMSWTEVKKQMSFLDLHEALYLCIQKVRIGCREDHE